MNTPYNPRPAPNTQLPIFTNKIYLFVFLILAIILSVLYTCILLLYRSNAKNTHQVLLSLDRITINVGVLNKDNTQHSILRLENDTGAHIKFEPAKISCGCLKLDRLPAFLKSGKQTTLILAIDTRRPPGQIDQTILLTWKDNTESHASTLVRITGILSGVSIDHDSVDFGVVSKGTTSYIRATLYGRNDTPSLSLTRSKSFELNGFIVDSQSQPNVMPLRIALRLKDNAELGYIADNCHLVLRSSSYTYKAEISLTAHSVGDVDVKPLRLLFNLSTINKDSHERLVKVVSPANKPINISSIPGLLTATLINRAGDIALFTIKLDTSFSVLKPLTVKLPILLDNIQTHNLTVTIVN